MQGGNEKDFRRASEVSGLPPHKYDALGTYQPGASLYSPYAENSGHLISSASAAKQLRHFGSLPGSYQSSSLGSLSTGKLTGLTRSQLAEEKHIRRQSSDVKSASRSQPMSAERSRPSSVSQHSTHDSLRSSSSNARRLSSARSDASTAVYAQPGGNEHLHSGSRSSSRPASSSPSSQTIAAYNPFLSRVTVTDSNQHQLPSRHSLGGTKAPSIDRAHLSSSIPSAPLLRRSSTGGTSGGHPYACQAAESWGQQQVKKRSAPLMQDLGPQDFLSLLQRSKGHGNVQASHSLPTQTNSNSREFLERSGQLIHSLGDKIRSITQRSPPRRTSSSSSSAAANHVQAYADRTSETREAVEPAQSSSPNRSTAAALDSTDASTDPGHIFTMDKLKSLSRNDSGVMKKRVDQPADAPSSSGSGADAHAMTSPSRGLGSSATSASVLHDNQYGMHGNPSIEPASSHHGFPVLADVQSSKHAGSHSTERYSIADQSQPGALPRQGVKSLEPILSDSLPAQAPARTSSSMTNEHHKHKSGIRATACTAQQDTAFHLNVASQQDVPRAQQATNDEAKALFDSAARASAKAAQHVVHDESLLDSDAEAAAKPAEAPAALHVMRHEADHVSVSDGAASSSQASAAAELSALHQSLRKKSGLGQSMSSQQLSAAISASAAASADTISAGASGVPESAETTMTSSHLAAEPCATPSQQLPAVSPSTARQLAAELAESVQLPHSSSDPAASTLRTKTRIATQQPQEASVESPLPSSSVVTRDSHQGDPQQEAGAPSPSASEATGEGVASGKGSEVDSSARQPSLPHSPSPQLAGSTPELKQAIELSLSHEFLPNTSQQGQADQSTGHIAEQPSVSASPGRQPSDSSPELNEAIRMSLSAEFLPQVEHELASHSASTSPNSHQHAEPDSCPSQHTAAASTDPTSTSVPVNSVSQVQSPVAMSAQSRSPQISMPHPTSSASHASQHAELLRTHKEQPQASTGPTPGLHPTPVTAPQRHSLPESAESEAAPSSPVHNSTAAQEAPNCPALVKESSPAQSPTKTEQQGPSTNSPAPDSLHASTSGRATPAPIHTSSSPKPPKPSPGTAAQIDGDAALALQLQKLELGNEAAEADSSTAAAPAEALEDDVDLAALQDVEVPLVGEQLPLAALVEDYEGSPRVCGNLVPLMQRFPYFRRIRGDGNCFYRAVMMALVENLCLDPDTAKCRRLLSRLDLLYQRLKVWEGIDDNYFLCVRKGWYQIRDWIHYIHSGEADLEYVMAYMCRSKVDSCLVHFLRAITALELWRKREHYTTFIPGMDAYGGLTIVDILLQAVLPMGTEVEHLQVKALVATLPIRLKILDVAGTAASIYTFEPGLIDSRAGEAATRSMQNLWLIYRPGHYEIVYPEADCEDLEKL